MPSLGPGGEDAGPLDHDVDAQLAPGALGRVADGDGLDLLAVDDQVLVVVLDRAGKAAVGAVVLQQRGQHLVVGQVVDGDHFELVAAFDQAAKRQPADAAKTIDGDFDCHESVSSELMGRPERISLPLNMPVWFAIQQ